MQNTDIKDIMIIAHDSGIKTAILLAIAERIASANRGIVIVTADQDAFPSNIAPGLADTKKPLVMELKPYDLEALDNDAILVDSFTQNQSMLCATQKKKIQFQHNRMTHTLLKQSRGGKRPFFQSRKFY